MTSKMNSRHVMFTLALAAMVAIGGSVWAMGNGQPNTMMMEEVRIDVSTMMTTIDVTNMPILIVENPI